MSKRAKPIRFTKAELALILRYVFHQWSNDAVQRTPARARTADLIFGKIRVALDDSAPVPRTPVDQDMSRRLGWKSTPKTPWPKAVLAAPNRVNIWECRDCKKLLVCIDLHVGVTPFMMDCDPARTKDGCGGPMYSRFYNVGDPTLTRLWAGRATHEWFVPEESQRRRLDRNMLEHVLQGGLDIRPRASLPGDGK